MRMKFALDFIYKPVSVLLIFVRSLLIFTLYLHPISAAAMHLPDRSDWKGSDAIWGQLTTVKNVCHDVSKLETDNLSLKRFLTAISGFGQAVVDQSMKEGTPGSALIEAIDPFLEVLQALPSQMPLYANYTERHCLGHGMLLSAEHTKETLLSVNGPCLGNVDEDSLELKYVRERDAVSDLRGIKDPDAIILALKYKHTIDKDLRLCTHYESVRPLLGHFNTSSLLTTLIALKAQMKIWHKSVMQKRAEAGWKDLHSLAFREWHGNLGTRKNITYLVRFCEVIKEKYYEDELLLDLAKELNNLCYEISHGRFTGLNAYIDALVKIVEKIPDTLGTEKEEEVLECRGHEPRRSAYSRFTVDGRKKEVDHELCCDKSINPLTIKTWTVDPHPAWASWIMVFSDTSYVATEYKHVDNTKGCYNYRKVTKTVGGIKKAEVLSVLQNLKTTLKGAQASKAWDARVESWHARMLDRIENRICPPITFQYTWSSAPTFTAEQLERFRNGGLTNAQMAQVGRRIDEGVERSSRVMPSLNGVPLYICMPGQGKSLTSSTEENLLNRFGGLPSLPRPIPGDSPPTAVIISESQLFQRYYGEALGSYIHALPTVDEKIAVARDYWGLPSSLPTITSFEASAQEAKGYVATLDNAIHQAGDHIGSTYERLKSENPTTFKMLETVTESAMMMAYAVSCLNPAGAIAAGAIYLSNATGATAWAKEKIRTELKELGFEKSCDTLAAGIILVAESKASGWTRNGATQSAALTKIAEKAHGKVYTRVDELSYVSGGRKVEGVAHYSRPLPTPETILRGSQNSVGIVPQEVASKMSGKSYNNFDAFRKDFWKAMADSKYAREFHIDSVLDMKRGLAPRAHDSQWLGNRKSLELHHRTPINQGGAVYDLSNILIVTPKYHKEMLLDAFHFGKKGERK